MNKKVKEIVRLESQKLNRHLHIPAIYKHFKEFKDNEEMLYIVTNVSLPINREDIKKAINTCQGFYMIHHTELEINIPIIRIEDRYYHNEEADKNILVMYTSLYGARESYVRPFKMFLSKVDKNKYPNAKQKYRLEKI